MANKTGKRDVNQQAAALVSEITGAEPPTGVYDALMKRLAAKEAAEVGKNPAAVALGRLGGLKGGKARAAALTPEQRKQIASEAAKKRWAAKKEQPDKAAILRAVAKGETTAEVAKRFGVTATTVRSITKPLTKGPTSQSKVPMP